MTTDLTSKVSWEHYRREHEPRSTGRVLLSHALVTHTLLNWGMNGDEIADAFGPEGCAADREAVVAAISLFEKPLLEGRFCTWARPIGGGSPTLLEPSHWEIDDFTPRFASSAINLERPFEATAAPTHWIFVEEVVVEALHELHEGASGARRLRRAFASPTPSPEPVLDALARSPIELDGLLTRAVVERLVGLKKSTIYDRIAQGRFPAPIRNGERLSSWREEEVRAWLRDPK